MNYKVLFSNFYNIWRCEYGIQDKFRDCCLELEVKKVDPIISKYRKNVNFEINKEIFGWRDEFGRQISGF